MNNPENTNPRKDTNPDPITGEPGAHPVATGIGAAGAGAAGAAIGMVAGPVGAAVGAVIGAAVGGLGGHAAGEAINPSAEDAHWRANHGSQHFATPTDRYEDFQPAYRSGYEGYQKHSTTAATFDKAEAHIRSDYEAAKASLPWEKARHASRAAWNRVQEGRAAGTPGQ